MDNEIIYTSFISNMRRLIDNDDSDHFKIIIKLTNEDKNKNNNNNKNEFEINTTINKARVLSKKINDAYLIDPTIDKYEIHYSTPKNHSMQSTDTNGSDAEQVYRVIQKMIKSAGQAIRISDSDEECFFRHLIHLGEESAETNGKSTTLPSSIECAVSLLSTEFHERSVAYLSAHLSEFVRSVFFNDIKKVIDSYFGGESKETNRSEERDQIIR